MSIIQFTVKILLGSAVMLLLIKVNTCRCFTIKAFRVAQRSRSSKLN